MANTGLEQVPPVLKRSGVTARHTGKFADIRCRKVGQRIHLQVASVILDRVQLRRVGRPEDQAYMRMRFQEIPHHCRPLGQPVPFRRGAKRADPAHLAMGTGTLTDHGGLSARCPATPDQRSRQERRFVDENQPGLQARRFLPGASRSGPRWQWPTRSR